MDLSIIIVNWNSAHYAVRCIHGIYSLTQKLEFEVVVVDNASSDDSCRILLERFPQVRLIRSPENIGFARANNLGFKHSSGRNILFLNPDTEILGSAINTMYGFLESSPGVGIVSCKLLNSDLSLATSCIQPFPTILNQIAASEWLKRRFPKSKLCGIAPLFAESNGTPADVEVVPGTCLMIKREVFEKVRLFGTDYFMYGEDVDLCYKVWQAGWKVCYIGNANVVHHGGQSSKQRKEEGFGDIVMRESTLKFLQKTRGVGYVQLYRTATFMISILRLSILGVLLAVPIATDKTSIRWSFKKWHKILRWSVGLESWTRLPASAENGVFRC